MSHTRAILSWATLLAALAACGGGDATSAAQDPNLFTVKKDDLPITVRENAELQAQRETIVRSEVEGQSTIIFITPEGTNVKQGDKLLELDVSELVEKASTQEINVGKAKSALEQARAQQSILEKELTTKRNTAASQLRIAGMELQKLLGGRTSQISEGRNSDMVKRLRELVGVAEVVRQGGDPSAAVVSEPTPASGPAPTPAIPLPPPPAAAIARIDPHNFAPLVDKVLKLLEVKTDKGEIDSYDRDMGDMANRILTQADKIRLAMASLKVKEDKVSYSRRLAARQFITRNELEGDELDYQSQVSQVTIAWNDLELLVNYELPKDSIKLEQDLANASLELERVEASNDAERKKCVFDIEAKDMEYVLAKERLENLQRQIKSAVIHAPTPGTVVYARLDRNRGGDAVREGVQVRERQELIILPDTTKMRCMIKVQEAQVDKVGRGQPAHVSVEAFQGETFTGRVTSVAPVADSNSGWMTSDRKVYTTYVELDSENPDGRLRSRMAANVTISVDTVHDTLPVPLQAVFRDRSVNYVWKRTPAGAVATRIKVGRQNTERVEVLEGVAAGDVLLLTAPAGMQAPKFEQPVAPDPAPLKTNDKPVADANANGTGTGDGNGDGPRGPRNPGSGPSAMNKKLAEMTAEELDAYKGRLDGMTRMVDGTRQSGNLDAANEMEAALTALRAALDKNDLVAGQVQQDKLRAAMRRQMGKGSGGKGSGGNGGGRGGG